MTAPVELRVGDLVFDARAAGPADGPTSCSSHGFPQTSACVAAPARCARRRRLPRRRARPARATRPGPAERVRGVRPRAPGRGHRRLGRRPRRRPGPPRRPRLRRSRRVAHRLPPRRPAADASPSCRRPIPRAVARSILEGGEQRQGRATCSSSAPMRAEGWFLDDDAAGLRAALTGVDAE